MKLIEEKECTVVLWLWGSRLSSSHCLSHHLCMLAYEQVPSSRALPRVPNLGDPDQNRRVSGPMMESAYFGPDLLCGEPESASLTHGQVRPETAGGGGTAAWKNDLLKEGRGLFWERQEGPSRKLPPDFYPGKI